MNQFAKIADGCLSDRSPNEWRHAEPDEPFTRSSGRCKDPTCWEEFFTAVKMVKRFGSPELGSPEHGSSEFGSPGLSVVQTLNFKASCWRGSMRLSEANASGSY